MLYSPQNYKNYCWNLIIYLIIIYSYHIICSWIWVSKTSITLRQVKVLITVSMYSRIFFLENTDFERMRFDCMCIYTSCFVIYYWYVSSTLFSHKHVFREQRTGKTKACTWESSLVYPTCIDAFFLSCKNRPVYFENHMHYFVNK